MAVGNVVGSGAPIRYAPLAVTWLWSAIRPSPTKNREAEKFYFRNKEKRRTERRRFNSVPHAQPVTTPNEVVGPSLLAL